MGTGHRAPHPGWYSAKAGNTVQPPPCLQHLPPAARRCSCGGGAERITEGSDDNGMDAFRRRFCGTGRGSVRRALGALVACGDLGRRRRPCSRPCVWAPAPPSGTGKPGFVIGGEAAAPAARRRQRVLSCSACRARRRGRRLCARILGGRGASRLRPAGPRVVGAVLLLNMGFVLLCANGLHFLIGWEIFTVCAYFLITLERQRPEVRAAGWLYLAASHVAKLCLFAFFALLAARTGGWGTRPDARTPGTGAAVLAGALGFGIKAGFFPLHIWLPSAHANAPSHVSAIMSGMAIKMGIYGLVRFTGWLPVPDAAGWVVAALGVDERRAGRGVRARPARSQTPARLSQRGKHRHHPHRPRLRDDRGRRTAMPPWGRLALAGRAAARLESRPVQIAAVPRRRLGVACHRHARNEPARRACGARCRGPPACSRSARWPLPGCRRSTVLSANGWCISACLTPCPRMAPRAGPRFPPPSCWLTGALALACFVKVCGVVFLGAAAHGGAEHVHECGWPMRGPMLVLGAACVAIGLAPVLFWPAMARRRRPGSRLGPLRRRPRRWSRSAPFIWRWRCSRFWRRRCSGGACSSNGVSRARNVGLRLRRADAADAIHRRLVRRHHHRMV